VDEADIIKSDGRYLFMAKNPLAWQPGNASLPGLSIRVLELFSSRPRRSRGGNSLADFGRPVSGLYLVNGRGSGKPDLLAAVGGRSVDMWSGWINPWFWKGGKTEIALYNVSTPSAPVKIARLSLDGQLIASRRIGEVLYVVTRYTPSLRNFVVYPMTAQASQQNEALLQQAKLADLLPGITVNGPRRAAWCAPMSAFCRPEKQGSLRSQTSSVSRPSM